MSFSALIVVAISTTFPSEAAEHLHDIQTSPARQPPRLRQAGLERIRLILSGGDREELPGPALGFDSNQLALKELWAAP